MKWGGWVAYECYLNKYAAALRPGFIYPVFDISCQYADKTDKRCAKGCHHFHDPSQCKTTEGKMYETPAPNRFTMDTYDETFDKRQIGQRKQCWLDRPPADYIPLPKDPKGASPWALTAPWIKGYEKQKGTKSMEAEAKTCETDDSNWAPY